MCLSCFKIYLSHISLLLYLPFFINFYSESDLLLFFFFFQAEDGIRDYKVTGVQTCALPILRLAGVNGNDLVYDLGSGDGRLVIAAARDFGARGVGIEIDPHLVAQSAESADRKSVV